MLKRRRPCSQSYHVGAVCGEPSRLSEGPTAWFGLAKKASTSGEGRGWHRAAIVTRRIECLADG
jgi:hypothetical protein